MWFLTWHCLLALGAISPVLLWVTHSCKLNGLARNELEQPLLVLSAVTRAVLQSISKMKGVRWQWPFITSWSPTCPWPALLELSGELLAEKIPHHVMQNYIPQISDASSKYGRAITDTISFSCPSWTHEVSPAYRANGKLWQNTQCLVKPFLCLSGCCKYS